MAPPDPRRRPTRRPAPDPDQTLQDSADGSGALDATADWGTRTGGPGAGGATTQARDPLIGKELGGCEILRFLGQGGMATVYLARQLGLEREVAVKVLSPKLTRDEGQVEQFMREARTLGKLEHPNIVTVYGVGQEEQTRFLVIQLVKGGSLQDLLKKRQKLPAEEATALVRQIARGLGEAHRKGIIHRDIKPGNILVAPGPTMKVTDFGLALINEGAGEALSEGRIVGTPHYISPEQVDAREVDARTDIYSLGATFYHLVTGAPPFTARTAVELLLKHVSEPLKPAHQRAPDVPEPLSGVISRMLAKDPAARFQSMDEVLAALERPEAAPPPAPVEAAASITLDGKATLLVSQGELAPFTQQLRPIEVKTPAALRHAAVGLLVFTGVLFGLGLGPLKTVLADMGASQAGFSAEEQAASAALSGLKEEAATLDDVAAIERYAAFVGEHKGTLAAKAATGQLELLRKRVAATRRKALETLLADVQAKREAAALGPALDRLGEVSEELLALPEAKEVETLRAALTDELDERGVAWVPAGECTLGEGTRHKRMFLQGYYIGLREVTQGEYAAFLAGAGVAPPEAWSGAAPPEPALPVAGVSAAEALRYAEAQGGRLPTYAEWERAARGDAGVEWPWGPENEPSFCNWGLDATTLPRPPGSFPRDVSPVGCLDMAGNVAELTTGPGHTAQAPVVWVRGGSFRTRVFATARPAFYLDGVGVDTRHEAVGFRIAFDALPAKEGGE